MGTRFLILSDLHLEFAGFEVPVAESVNFDAVILAGDIHNPGTRGVRWAQQQPAFAGKPVFYVPGNHELYGREMRAELRDMQRSCRDSAVQLLDGTCATLGNVRILGCMLWTDFELPTWLAGRRLSVEAVMDAAAQGMNDYARIRYRTQEGGALLTPEVTRRIHHRQRAWLQRQIRQPWEGPTVVVTHHGPSRRSVAPQFENDWLTPSFVSDLPVSMFEGVALWVHGHTHASFDYEVGRDGRRCRVVCNPRGNPMGWERRSENEAFVAGMVVEV